MVEQIYLILLFIFMIKGISWLFDNSKEPPPQPEKIPDDASDNELRKFYWTVEDNIRSHVLSCEIKINPFALKQSKEELLNDSQPSKISFTCDEEYFTISKYQILHDTFGQNSSEIGIITSYLRGYADKNFLSNYQFANLILSFVHEQNIKYSYDKVSTGYVEYLRFPIETIYDTTGDCDCKAILASTLFKKSGFRVAFALMPGHAALAISTESSPFYSNLEMNGTNWFYCESTGDNWKPGQLPSDINFNAIKIKEIL